MDNELNLPCGQTLPNRLAKAAISEALAGPDLAPSEGLMKLWDRWADSGAGLLITGNVMVDARHLGEPGNVAADRDDPRFREWASRSKAGGAKVWVQLNHPGRQSPKMMDASPVAPSAIAVDKAGLFAVPRALEDEGILEIIERFAAAAERMERAGFDGVEIHGAHGYLVSQFLSPRTNVRTDRWGGSLENRARLLLDIVRAVRARVSASFAVAVKMNSADFQRGGFDEDDAVVVARWLEDAGVDLLEISGGSYEAPAMTGRASTVAREAYFLDFAERVRQETTLPLMVTGGFRSAEGMRAALASGGRSQETGACDLVGIARPMIIEPNFPKLLLSGELERAPSPLSSTRVKLFDDLLQIAWYQAQLQRMARGESPDPQLGRFGVLTRKLAQVAFTRRAA